MQRHLQMLNRNPATKQLHSGESHPGIAACECFVCWFKFQPSLQTTDDLHDGLIDSKSIGRCGEERIKRKTVASIRQCLRCRNTYPLIWILLQPSNKPL